MAQRIVVENRRVLIAASGTGGHLFPAVEIGRELQHQAPETELLFVGSGRPLESEIIGNAGYELALINTVGLQRRGVKGLLKFILTLPRALAQTVSIFRRFRPNLVLGVGGYISFLPVVGAWLLRIPTWIHEAEERPGWANRVLSRLAGRISTAQPETDFGFPQKTVWTGQPVRRELRSLRAVAVIPSKVSKLLVLGGSQGAKALDEALPQLSPVLHKYGLQLRHQARPEGLKAVADAYRAAGVAAEVFPFVDSIESYRWADLIISRSGAGTVRELGVVNLPAILVPFPHAQGGHQLLNARQLETAGKALIVEEGEGFVERLSLALEELLQGDNYRMMHSRPYEPAGMDAAQVIARGILAVAS